MPEDIYVGRVLNVVEQGVDLLLADALLLKEVLTHIEIEADLRGLLQELLLFVDEVLRDHTGIHLMGRSQGELLLEGGALLLGAWVRLDIVLAHKVE